MPGIGVRLYSIFFKLWLKHQMLHTADHQNGKEGHGVVSRPQTKTVPANAAFVDGVATKDVNIDPQTCLSVRIFLPRSVLPTEQAFTVLDQMWAEKHMCESVEDFRQKAVNNANIKQGYLPQTKGLQKKLPIIVQFHGGAFVLGSKNSVANDQFCRRMAKVCDAIVLAVGYRLAPEHKCPAAFDDGVEVLHWLAKQAKLSECSKSWEHIPAAYLLGKADNESRDLVDRFGALGTSMVEPWLSAHGDPSRCVLLGVSSGANIADSVSKRAVEAGRILEPVKIIAQVLMYPFFLGRLPTRSELKLANSYFYDKETCILAWKLFLPDGEFDMDHPAANPLLPTRQPPLCQMPPTLTIVAELDWLKDRAIAYSEALRKAKVDASVLEYKDAVHDFATLDTFINSRQAESCAEDMAIWMKKYISSKARARVLDYGRLWDLDDARTSISTAHGARGARASVGSQENLRQNCLVRSKGNSQPSCSFETPVGSYYANEMRSRDDGQKFGSSGNRTVLGSCNDDAKASFQCRAARNRRISTEQDYVSSSYVDHKDEDDIRLAQTENANLDQWKLSDAISTEWIWRRQQRKRLLRRVRRPPTDDGARRLIQQRRTWQRRLRNTHGPQVQVPKWIQHTPEQMAEYHANGGYAPYPMRYKIHVEAAIATVRRLASEESYDMRTVMAPWVGRFTFRELCTVLKWQKRWKQAQDFFAWMKLQLSYIPSVIAYSILLKIYGKAGKLDLAEAAFQEMIDQGLEPDEVAFSTMILNYAEADLYDEMMSMYEAMLGRSIVPSSVIYTTMIVHLNKASRLSDAILLWEDLVEEAVEANAVTFSLMITIYRKQGCFEEALQVFESMLDAGCHPDGLVYNMALYMMGKVGRYEDAVDVFHAMQLQDISPSKYSYATMLHICEKADKFELAASIFCDMQMKRCPIDEVVYTSVISIYGKVGLYDEAEKLFGEMDQLKLLVDVKTFVVMANVRSKSGKYNEAVQLMEDLLSRGLAMDDTAWKTLLHCYVKTGNVQGAEKIFKSLLESGTADLMAYSDLLNLYAESDRLEDAKRLFTQLKESSLQPDQVSYGTMIKVYCKANMLKDAEMILREMQEQGYSPDYISKATLMNAYGEANKLEDAAGLFNNSDDDDGPALISKINLYLKFRLFEKASLLLSHLFDSSVALDSATYNQLTINFVKAGQIPSAELLYSKMQERGFDVEDSTLGHLIAAYGKRCQYQMLRNLFESVSKTGLHGGTFVYSSMIGALVNCNRVDEATELFAKMESSGLKYDNVLISILVNAYSKAGMDEKVDALVEKAKNDQVILDVVAYNTIIKANLRAGRLKKAINTFSMIRELGVLPSLQTYDTMISVFAKSGRTQDAEKLFKELKASGFQPDEKLYSQMMNCYAKAGLYTHAADMFQAMKLRGLKPHEVTYNNLVDAYARAGCFAEAENVLDDMRKGGCPPSSVTYLLLISGYAHKRKGKEADSVLQRMWKLGVSPDVRHYNEVILSFSRAGLLKEAVRMYSEMERSGIQPDLVCNRTMMKIYLDSSMFEEGISLYKRFELQLEKDSFTQNMLVKLYEGAGKYFEARYLLRQAGGYALNGS